MALTKVGNFFEDWWSDVHKGQPATSKVGRLIENWWKKVVPPDPQPATPAPEPPEGPILPEGGADPYAAFLRRRKRSGRAQTILTGSLSPTDIGQRTLLG